ncbi:hypothetical protein BGZ96_011729 [Linnemannia gamsii]|uniref:Extracellular membrane protein CFEM domain-containing protein n=1 Tax=Linnemannia gamsii TaxID=64522 RepID=A0ABQ7KCD4_9FUNG|nr:hypothetical protein BGZ96_011729 [Linnemannia gamsii]
MTRSLSMIVFAAVAAMALLASETVDAQAGKPQCAPIHTVYKSFTNPCTQNGAVIPNSDADKRWLPCICKAGFFPVAQAAEKCVLDGVSQAPAITASGLDALCVGQAGYTAAASQTASADLTAAVAAAASISATLPTPTAGAGGDGTTGGNGTTGGPGRPSGGYRMADGSSSVVMVGMTAFAAVVLATAAAF